jgi:RimJ/RimL family protein N-acetyltransferase
MLTGRSVTLRELRRSDLPVLHRDLESDVVTSSIGSSQPWRPTSLAALEAEFDRSLTEAPDERNVRFAVQERGEPTGALIGTTGLWRIDLHNGTAHLGIQLVPSARGRGLGLDVVRALCHYAFAVRGLHRIGLETLATNEGMRRTAVSAGFVEEGRLREGAFLLGERVDEILYGLLRSEWEPGGVEL